MQLLVIEDNTRLAANIVDYLESCGYAVDAAADGITGLHLTVTGNYEVVILDVALPGVDGITLCQRIRAAHIATPIIMLTARGELEEKIDGLEAGADDYLVKPVALSELAVRIKAQIRRARGGLISQRLKVADLELNEETFEVVRSGQQIALTRVDFELLRVLMRESPRVVARQRLEAEVWGEALPETDTLRTHIHRLRRAIDRPFGQPLLHTVHGVGYRLVGSDALPS